MWRYGQGTRLNKNVAYIDGLLEEFCIMETEEEGPAFGSVIMSQSVTLRIGMCELTSDQQRGI
jgi:hypothetical protein